MKEEKLGYQKLKAFFVEKGIKQNDVAEILNLSRTAFNCKLNRNGLDFTLDEVRTICKTYEIKASEFFLI
ncbi:helix-turn-helix domain-containing protein [Fusobacterium necrophorum subsp. funduliforme]